VSASYLGFGGWEAPGFSDAPELPMFFKAKRGTMQTVRASDLKECSPTVTLNHPPPTKCNSTKCFHLTVNLFYVNVVCELAASPLQPSTLARRASFRKSLFAWIQFNSFLFNCFRTLFSLLQTGIFIQLLLFQSLAHSFAKTWGVGVLHSGSFRLSTLSQNGTRAHALLFVPRRLLSTLNCRLSTLSSRPNPPS